MERRKRSQHVPYVPGPEADARIMRFVGRALKLPNVTSIALAVDGIYVERALTDEEPVLPAGLQDLLEEDEWPGTSFLLQHLELEAAEVSGNPMLLWNHAVTSLGSRDLRACAVLVPPGDAFDAYVGLPEGANVAVFLGLHIHRAAEVEIGKLVFIGSPTGLLADATHGIVVDTGEMG